MQCFGLERTVGQRTKSSSPNRTWLTQWHSGGKDDHCDDQRDDGVEIVLERPRRLPDDKTGGNHTDVSQSVPKNMQQNSLHVH